MIAALLSALKKRKKSYPSDSWARQARPSTKAQHSGVNISPEIKKKKNGLKAVIAKNRFNQTIVEFWGKRSISGSTNALISRRTSNTIIVLILPVLRLRSRAANRTVPCYRSVWREYSHGRQRKCKWAVCFSTTPMVAKIGFCLRQTKDFAKKDFTEVRHLSLLHSQVRPPIRWWETKIESPAKHW